MAQMETPEESDHGGGTGGDTPRETDASEDAVEIDEEDDDLYADEEDDDGDDADDDVMADALEDIEDEFAEFVDEEMGYADIDWDTIPQKQVDEHDRIRQLGWEALRALDLRRANDLYRWAAARVHLDHGDDEGFEALAEKLLASKKRSKALDYIDIGLVLMGQQAARGDFDAAFATLDKLAAMVDGDEGLVERFRGILMIQKGDGAAGLELLAQLAEKRPDDANFLLSLGEDLCGIAMWEPALEYLEVAEELARANADTDLLASIENAIQFAQAHIPYDDVD